jgi:hypothetical protein
MINKQRLFLLSNVAVDVATLPRRKKAFVVKRFEGRNRTGTLKEHRFLRPTCLPIPPLRQRGLPYRDSPLCGQELRGQKKGYAILRNPLIFGEAEQD